MYLFIYLFVCCLFVCLLKIVPLMIYQNYIPNKFCQNKFKTFSIDVYPSDLSIFDNNYSKCALTARHCEAT